MIRHDSIEENTGGVGPLIFVVIIWAAIVGFSIFAYRPVQPQPASIPAAQFSSARADQFLNELVGDSIPHPAGSEQNTVVREKIVTRLESFDYTVEIQSGSAAVSSYVQSRYNEKPQVELHNVIAVLRADTVEGQTPRKPIMLVSHYDSVPSGPGASDDGVATAAVIEIARMLANEPAPDRDIVFLITDGEEYGLLGAKLFVDQHPLAKTIGMTINLEARGTAGPSCMFETSRMSRWLIPIFSRAANKKFASSLFVEVYKRMPNDTDFSVFRRAGMLGYNFAFVGDVKNYHTTADNYENADQGSLQHHGENALGLIRELLDANEAEAFDSVGGEALDEAVYFDLFGKWIVWWPSGWSIWLSAFALVMLAIGGGRLAGGRKEGSPDSGFSSIVVNAAKHFCILLLTIGLVFAIGYAIQIAVRLDPRMSNPWPSQPVPMLLGYWLASFAVVGAIAIAFSKYTTPGNYLIAFLQIWIIFAFTSSYFVNGASHLFLVPALITATFGLIACWFGRRGMIATLVVAAISVGVMWLPLERLFYDAVGFRMPIVMMARVALVSTAMIGLISLTNDRHRFWFSILSAVSSVGMFVAAIVLA